MSKPSQAVAVLRDNRKVSRVDLSRYAIVEYTPASESEPPRLECWAVRRFEEGGRQLWPDFVEVGPEAAVRFEAYIVLDGVRLQRRDGDGDAVNLGAEQLSGLMRGQVDPVLERAKPRSGNTIDQTRR